MLGIGRRAPLGMRGAAMILAAAAALLTAACTTTYDRGYSAHYRYGHHAHRDGLGVIVNAHEVMVRSDGRGGAVVGAIAGGATGAALGGDTEGSIAGGVIGAVIGGILGSEIEKSSSAHPAIRYRIDMDYGETITVIQDDSRYYPPGTRVRVHFGDYVDVVPVGRRYRRY